MDQSDKEEEVECKTGICDVDMKPTNNDTAAPISNNLFNTNKIIAQQHQNHRISVIQVYWVFTDCLVCSLLYK